MIQKLKIEGEKNKEIKVKINEIIEYLNQQEAPTPLPINKVPVVELPYSPSPLTRGWKPVGDGQKYWTDPNGFTKPVSDVPDEYLEELTSPKND